MPEEYKTLTKFDRIRGELHGVALFSKPSTIKNMNLIGQAETFVVETGRLWKGGDQMGKEGDYVWIEMMDGEGGLTRIVLPPKVTDAIAYQRDSLTTKRRKIIGKTQAKLRKDRGELPGFMLHKKQG